MDNKYICEHCAQPLKYKWYVRVEAVGTTDSETYEQMREVAQQLTSESPNDNNYVPGRITEISYEILPCECDGEE
jgi:hypothetical protein